MRNVPLDLAITEELIRQAPPGSSWNDRERDQWEADMRATVGENFANKLGD